MSPANILTLRLSYLFLLISGVFCCANMMLCAFGIPIYFGYPELAALAQELARTVSDLPGKWAVYAIAEACIGISGLLQVFAGIFGFRSSIRHGRPSAASVLGVVGSAMSVSALIFVFCFEMPLPIIAVSVLMSSATFAYAFAIARLSSAVHAMR